MRKGFGMMVAIIIMMTVSILMTLMISYSSSSSKSTVDLYLKEQAQLLARSATEYALLAISAHENNQSCIESINMSYPNNVSPTHEMNVSIWYLGSGLPATCTHMIDNSIVTPDSNLTAIIDVIVSVDINRTGITEPIRLHRRTVQKP